MSNIFINNYNSIKLKTSKSEYWDFILSKNNDPSELLVGNSLYDTNLISYINMDDNRCYSGDTIYNTTDYRWLNAFNSGLTLSNIGFTGIDNGLIKFDKNNINSIDFFNLITGSTYSIQTGETRLKLNSVSGNTGNYVYPLEYVDGADLNSIYFNGGFYQGFFKSNDVYQILPDNIEKEITFDFTLKPDFITTPQPNTLNEKYINNKGIFFYMGIRAENKFWYDYKKITGETFDISSTGNTTPLEATGNTLTTNDGFDIETQGIYKIETDNKFILFNRTPYGLDVHTYNPERKYYLTGETKNNPNLFTFLNRSEANHTVHDIPIQETELKYSIYDDVNRNNIAFRIKDDGSVGYRLLTIDCENNLIVEEEYSNANIVLDDTWSSVVVRLVLSEKEKCQTETRTMKLMFYVNSNLVLVSKPLPEIFFRELLDRQEKQEGVAYNISLGGGTQGLCDMIGFDADYETQYLLPIEENFAGSFIGDINKFRIFYGKHDYSKIKNNYNYEFGITTVIDYVEPTIDFIVSGNSLNYPDSANYREIGDLESVLNGLIIVNKPLNKPIKPLTGYNLYFYPNGSNQTQINGLFPINATGGTITEYTHNDPSFLQLTGITYLKYMIEVFDTYRTTVGTKKIKEIIFDNMIFYGNTDIIPSGATEIRNLSNKVFNSGVNELTLQTGNANKIFVVAVPTTKQIDLVLDENAMFADITRTYLLTEMLIEDAGGNPTPYNVYVMQNAIPYTRNHNHKITFI